MSLFKREPKAAPSTTTQNEMVRKLNRRATLMGIMLGLSLVASAGMAVSVATMNRTILVPTLVDTVEISPGRVDRDYLERLSRDVVYTFLNRTPESARYFERNLERLVLPATYIEIKKQLIADRQERQRSQTSQVFYPIDMFVDPSRLYVEATGNLVEMSSAGVVREKQESYALRFRRRGSLVLLESIVPIDRTKAEGRSAKVSNQGEPL